jgi:glutathione peroxidase
MQSVYDFSAKDITGKDVSLSQFKGKYLLIVNVASQCGFTSQYKGLEDLYRELQNQVVVLGFPCNQFGKQEPGDETEIKQFCTLNYDVTFPLFGKINVNGSEAHPLYQFLKGEAPGVLGTEAIKWNFTKFLVSKDGQVIKRFAPTDTPEKIKAEIKSL